MSTHGKLNAYKNAKTLFISIDTHSRPSIYIYIHPIPECRQIQIRVYSVLMAVVSVVHRGHTSCLYFRLFYFFMIVLNDFLSISIQDINDFSCFHQLSVF